MPSSLRARPVTIRCSATVRKRAMDLVFASPAPIPVQVSPATKQLIFATTVRSTPTASMAMPVRSTRVTRACARILLRWLVRNAGRRPDFAIRPKPVTAYRSRVRQIRWTPRAPNAARQRVFAIPRKHVTELAASAQWMRWKPPRGGYGVFFGAGYRASSASGYHVHAARAKQPTNGKPHE